MACVCLLVLAVLPSKGVVDRPMSNKELVSRTCSALYAVVGVTNLGVKPYRVQYTIKDPKELKQLASYLVFEGKVERQGPKSAPAPVVGVNLFEKDASGKAVTKVRFSMSTSQGKGQLLFGEPGGTVYECQLQDDKAFWMLVDRAEVKKAIEAAKK